MKVRPVTAGLVASAVLLRARGARGVRPWVGVAAGVETAEADETLSEPKETNASVDDSG